MAGGPPDRRTTDCAHPRNGRLRAAASHGRRTPGGTTPQENPMNPMNPMTPYHPLDRRLSLLTPSGRLTLGNMPGALRGMAVAQDTATCFYGVSDLHAM